MTPPPDHIIDITLRVAADLPVWPGDPRPQQHWLQRLADGDPCDLSQWTLGSHTGTHLDAPSHFVPGGADLDQVPLDLLVGPCVVLDLRAAAGASPAEISAETLLGCADTWLGQTRLLLATGGPSGAGVGISDEAADLLLARHVRLVGIDQLSIERAASVEAGAGVHRRLLSAGVVILEGLDLQGVQPGPYVLVALPLRLQHSEASPARAILLPA